MGQATTPSLVFGISVENLNRKLKTWKEQIANFANNDGKGYKLKIDFGEAETVIRQLKNLKIGDTTEIDKLQRQIDGLKKKLKELNDNAGIRTATENITKPLRRGADESKRVADDIEKSKKRIVDSYADLMKSVNALQMDRAHAKGLGVDVSGYSAIIRDMKTFAAEMSRLSDNKKFLGNPEAIRSMMSQYNNYIEVVRMLRNEINNLSRAKKEQSNSSEKQGFIDKRSVNEAIYQIALLENKITSLKKLQSEAQNFNLKTPNLDKLISDMNEYMQKFKAIFDNKGRLDDGTTAQMLKAEGAYRGLNARIAQNTQETLVNIAARKSAVSSVSLLAGEEMRLAQAISSSTSAMHKQSQVLTDMQSMAAQYIGLYGAKSFIDSIIEKGGQLEQQRLSIGAILQDTAHATDLFQKVKSLAVKSPFGVTEIDQMTKQLSAFGFEYSELFDLTKRMGDISAATGTGIDRLALALGHVKSEAALTGYTLRQFSMANVPLLAKLSEKLGVTTSQIRKMVSRKEISYEQVLEVLKELTDRGGMFFEAQETMSQALNAKFKNLRDSYEIMFNEIAESKVGDVLKDWATVLKAVSRRWEELFTIVGTGILTFGGMKTYLALVNTLLGANAAAVMNGIKAYQKGEVASLKLAKSYRDITLAENAMIATTHKWTVSERLAQSWIGRRIGMSRQLNDAQKFRVASMREQIVYGNALALSERRLTTEDLARQVALGKTSKAQARQAIILSDLTQAEKSAGVATVNSVRTYGMMTGAVNGTRMALSKFATTLKGVFLSPQTAIFAVIAGVMELWQRNKQEADKAKELTDDLFNRAMEGIKNVRTMMEATGLTFKVNDVEVDVGDIKDILNGKFSYKPASDMSTQDMIQYIDKWTQFVKEYSPFKNTILNDAFKDDKNNVRSVAEQYDILAKAVTDTAEAYVYLKQVSGAIEFAEKSTDGGWLDDSFITNINDYANAVKRYDDSITNLTMNHAQSVDAALAAARSEKTFANALRAANADLMKKEKRNLTQAEQLKMLIEDQDKYTDAIKAFEDARKKLSKYESKALGSVFHGSGVGWFGVDGPDKYASQVSTAFEKMDADATKWAESLKARLKEAGWVFSDLSASQKEAIAIAIAETVSKAGDATEDIREKVKKLASDKFGIPIDVNTAEAAAKVVALERSFKDLVGHDWTIDIKTATNFGDVISKIRQEYKSAQDYFNNVKPLMIKMGVDVTGGMKELGITQRNALINQWKKENPGKDATIFENMLVDYDSYAKKMNDAMGFHTATGISLSDPNSGGKTFRDKQSNKTDKELELWRKRIQLLEKYRQEMEQLEKLMTRAQAESKLKADGNFSPLWEYFSNPNDYIGSLDEVARKLGTKGDRKSFIDELGGKKGAEGLRVFKAGVSEAVSELVRLANIMDEDYDTYRKWIDLTGDSKLAAQIAGVAENSSMTGWLTDKMNAELKRLGDSRTASAIFGMSESQAKKFGSDSVIYKLWDEWQNNNKKIKKQNIDLYENAIKNAKGYAEKVADINRELEKEIAAIKEMTGGNTPTEEQQNQRTVLIKNATDTANKKIADETWNNFKATEEWGRIFADLDRISTGTLERMLAKLREIAPTLNGSVESTKAVYEAIDKVTNVVNGRNPLKAISESVSNRNSLRRYYKQAQKSGNLVANAELSNLLGVKLGSTVTAEQIKDGMKDEGDTFKKAVNDVVDGLQKFQSGLNLVGSVFDSLGMTSASNAVSDASSIIGGALSGASSLSALGPWGMAAGAALGIIGGIAQAHDASLERQIEAIEREVNALEQNTDAIRTFRDRTLGYDSGELRRLMANQYNNTTRQKTLYLFGKDYTFDYQSAALKAMKEFYKMNSGGTGYAQELENLKKQREDYIKMYDLEADKKKSSQDALDEYKAKIAELDDQIAYFTEDLENSLWGIDIQGWADQISDAITTAFENGEDAVKAFDDTVEDIMRDVANNILKVSVIEPMFERMRARLTGGTYNGKTYENPFNLNDPDSSATKIFGIISEEFDQLRQQVPIMQDVLEQLQALSAFDLKSSDSSKSSGNSIKSITEQTGDLLASYVNSCRADLSVIRAMGAQYWPMYYAALTSGNASLKNIENHTSAIMRSNDAIERSNQAILDRIDGLRNKAWKVPIA